MKIKKGDKVLISRGKERGKTGAVISVQPRKGLITVEGINIVTRHVRPRKAGEKGERIKAPRPIHVSRVKIVCGSCKKATRIGYKTEAEKKIRYCKKCQAKLN